MTSSASGAAKGLEGDVWRLSKEDRTSGPWIAERIRRISDRLWMAKDEEGAGSCRFDSFKISSCMADLEDLAKEVEASSPTIDRADILKEIQSVFFPYHKEPERSNPELWLTIGEVQDKEIRLSLLKGDKGHAIEEFADRAFVAIDGLSKMGYDPRTVMTERLDKIRQKDMTERNLAYYIAKGKRLDSEIAALNAPSSQKETEK